MAVRTARRRRTRNRMRRPIPEVIIHSITIDKNCETAYCLITKPDQQRKPNKPRSGSPPQRNGWWRAITGNRIGSTNVSIVIDAMTINAYNAGPYMPYRRSIKIAEASSLLSARKRLTRDKPVRQRVTTHAPLFHGSSIFARSLFSFADMAFLVQGTVAELSES